MTYREKIAAAVRGLPSDELPLCPRFDLWYNANKRRGTLPDKYRNATMNQIIEDLDVGYNTTLPDFRALETPEEEAHRALGIFQCADIFYQISFDLELKISRDGDELCTQYMTPHGTIRTKSLYNERMMDDGTTVSHISERAFKDEKDYKALEYVFRSARVKPRFDRIAKMESEAGDRGLPFAWVASSGSPMHYIQKQLMGFEQFFFELYDRPDEIARLAAAIGDMEEKIFSTMLEAPLEVYRVGGNYDSMMQNPDFFRDHILPTLRDRAERLQAAGKVLLTHTDGENDGLLDLYLKSGIDVAESLCPAPMTRLNLAEVRQAFGRKITIWGGIPSLLMLKDSFTDYEFESHLDSFFEAIGDGSRFVISVADTTPPDADFARIKRLVERAKVFGSVPGV